MLAVVVDADQAAIGQPMQHVMDCPPLSFSTDTEARKQSPDAMPTFAQQRHNLLLPRTKHVSPPKLPTLSVQTLTIIRCIRNVSGRNGTARSVPGFSP
jgi:hypothetical protein